MSSVRALGAVELLKIWECGLNGARPDRALNLLEFALPDCSRDEGARLSLGRRDAALLSLREATFGARLDCVIPCRQCSERLEATLDVDQLIAAEPVRVGNEIVVEAGGYLLTLRVPDSFDEVAATQAVDDDDARRILIDRCIVAALLDGRAEVVRELPDKVVDAAMATLAEIDPQADLGFAVTCPSCGHQWRALFDIVAFFSSEIDAWARRILREVHVLASAYGWRESDILALSATRRRIYLEMVGG
jgi:hypothetical protein